MDNTIRVTENIKFLKRIYEPEDWGSFREAVMSQNKIASEPVILKREIDPFSKETE